MGKSAPSVPQQPSAAETATAQAQANTSTAAAQAALNNVNQISPYGTTNYAQTGTYTTPEGQTVPTYTQTTALSPASQGILDQQQNLASNVLGSGQSLANQIKSSTASPLNFNTAFSSYLNQGPQQQDTNAANAIYNQQKSFLDPQWGQQGQQLQDQLSRQGIPVGSDAYNNAMTQFNNSKTQAYQSAQDAATAGGASSAANLFNLALTGQNQNINQQQLAQQQPISLLSQILGVTPSTPTQPISTPSQTPLSGTDIVGATASANNSAMQAYQAQLAQTNASNGAAGSVIGLAVTAAAAY